MHLLKGIRIIYFIVFISVFNSNEFHARGGLTKNYEIGIMPGFTYYMGDLNPEGHLNFELYHLAGAVFYKQNFNPRWSLRYMLMRGTLSGDDDLLLGTFPQRRNLNFTSSITEFSTLLEFNFFPFSAVKERSHPITPYLFWGLSGFHFSPKTNVGSTELDLNAQLSEGVDYSKISIAFPFGMGFKFRFTDRVFVGLEYGMRKTFTDYIDDVSTVYPETFYQRGDSRGKDWFQFIGLTLSVRVGSKITQCSAIESSF